MLEIMVRRSERWPMAGSGERGVDKTLLFDSSKISTGVWVVLAQVPILPHATRTPSRNQVVLQVVLAPKPVVLATELVVLGTEPNKRPTSPGHGRAACTCVVGN